MKRPIVPIPLEPWDWIIEILAFFGLMILILMASFHYGDLPEQIPIHFNLRGDPDNYGDKIMVYLLPAIGVLLSGIFFYTIKKPHRFNYPVKLTPENVFRQYRIATSMLRVLKTSVIWLFAFLNFKMIHTALGKADGLGNSFIYIFLCFVFLPIIYYSYSAFKSK